MRAGLPFRKVVAAAQAGIMSIFDGTNSAGALAAKLTVPSHDAAPVISYTSQPSATLCIHVPTFETNDPVQKSA